MLYLENKTEPNNTTEAGDLPKTDSLSSPQPETLTHSDTHTMHSDTGGTKDDKGLDTLTEKGLQTEKVITTPKMTEDVTSPKPQTTTPPGMNMCF